MLRYLVLISCSFAIAYSGACDEGASLGPKCKAFLNYLIPNLTAVFKPTEEVVCMINNDLGTCVPEGKTFAQCAAVLASKSGDYKNKLIATRADLLGTLTHVQNCLSNLKDGDYASFLKRTVIAGMSAILKAPYNKAILTKIKQMIQNGKSLAERTETACETGTAMTTNPLIVKVVKKVMSLTFKQSWQECIVPLMRPSSGVLLISKYVKSDNKCKQAGPSGK
ncbi:unnamed protein product, partial [Mesorhabditis spiculigera]